ncbi:MAG: hypothetical protein DRI24_21495, partial [Deltaproteobacteria bacterium]
MSDVGNQVPVLQESLTTTKVPSLVNEDRVPSEGPRSAALSSIVNSAAALTAEDLDPTGTFERPSFNINSSESVTMIENQLRRNKEGLIDEVANQGILNNEPELVKSALQEEQKKPSINSAALGQLYFGEEEANSSYTKVSTSEASAEVQNAVMGALREDHATRLLLNRTMTKIAEDLGNQTWPEVIGNTLLSFSEILPDQQVRNSIDDDTVLDFFDGTTLLNLRNKFMKEDLHGREAMVERVVNHFQKDAINYDPNVLMEVIAAMSGMTERAALRQNFETTFMALLGVTSLPGDLNILRKFVGAATGTTKGSARALVRQLKKKEIDLQRMSDEFGFAEEDISLLVGGNITVKNGKKVMENPLHKSNMPKEPNAAPTRVLNAMAVQSPAQYFKSMDLRKTAAAQVDETLKNTVDPEVHGSTVETLLPNYINPINDVDGLAPVIGDVMVKFIDDKMVPNGLSVQIADIPHTKQYTDLERMEALVQTVEEMRRGVPPQARIHGDLRQPVDIATELSIEEAKITGSQVIKMKIGIGRDGLEGIDTIENATELGKRLGLEDYTITPHGEKFFLEIEKGVSPSYTDPWLMNQGDQVRHIMAFARGSDIVNPLRLSEAAHLTSDGMDGVQLYLGRQIKVIKKLKAKERINLTTALSKGLKESEWYTDEVLKGKGFNLSNREIEAYHAYHKMSDTEFFIANATAYDIKLRSGAKTLHIDTDFAKSRDLNVIDAAPLESIDVPGSKTFYNATTGKTVDGISPSQLKAHLDDDYRVFRIADEPGTFSKTAEGYVLVKNSNVTVKPLRHMQLSYLKGGRRHYEGDKWIKQGNFAWNGSSLTVRNSKTFGNAITTKDAQKFVDGLEEARAAYRSVYFKGGGSDLSLAPMASARIQKALVGHSDLNSLEAFKKSVDEGNINPDIPFEFAGDGEQLTSVKDAMNKASDVLDLNEMKELNSRMRMNYRNGNSYSKRGNHLPDLNGAPAPILDPLEALDNSLHRITKGLGLGAYKRRLQDEWVKEFKDVLVRKPNDTPLSTWIDPKFEDVSLPHKVARVKKAKAVHAASEAFMGVKTKAERNFQDALDSIADEFSGVPILRNLHNSDPV